MNNLRNVASGRCLILACAVCAVLILPAVSHAQTWSVLADVAVTEGLSGTNKPLNFTVVSSATSDVPVSVDYRIEPVTAIEGTDYLAVSGTLSLPAGIVTNQMVSVISIGNNRLEGPRTFRFVLTNAVSSTIHATNGQKTGTINEVSTPTVSAINTNEGPSGSTNTLCFTVTLNANVDLPVSLAYTTENGLAMSNQDYLACSGLLEFTGQRTNSVLVPIIGNDRFEAGKTLTLRLLYVPSLISVTTKIATILNDDPEPARTGLLPGEELMASIFPGVTVNSGVGNPNEEGQAWFKANLSTVLKYYENPVRWAANEVPGSYPTYLDHSVVQWDQTVTNALRTSDANSKHGASWIFSPLQAGRYEISFSQLYAYPNGSGNIQLWKLTLYRAGSWQDVLPFQPFPVAPKSGGFTPGTNFVCELALGEKLAFVAKTGGTAFSGGSTRIEGLKVRRVNRGTVILIR